MAITFYWQLSLFKYKGKILMTLHAKMNSIDMLMIHKERSLTCTIAFNYVRM